MNLTNSLDWIDIESNGIKSNNNSHKTKTINNNNDKEEEEERRRKNSKEKNASKSCVNEAINDPFKGKNTYSY